MYKVGKYEYKSVESYKSLLMKLWFIFLILVIMLVSLKPFMVHFVYWFTFVVGIAMLVHLPLKYLDAKGKFKYIFREY